jgi:hypothetical protein
MVGQAKRGAPQPPPAPQAPQDAMAVCASSANPAVAIILAWAGGAGLVCLAGAPDAAPWFLGAAAATVGAAAMVGCARWCLRRLAPGRRAAK